MSRSKRDSELGIDILEGGIPNTECHSRSLRAPALQINPPQELCTDQFNLIEPQIDDNGIHAWPFDVSCPVDVRLLSGDGRHHVRKNRHSYCEVLYLCSGSLNCLIEDRILSLEEGDLAVLGSAVYHTIECQNSAVTIAVLYFEPDLIRCDGGSDSAEYLAPFLLQDSRFPHIVPAKSGVPRRVFDMMLRIHSELPAHSSRSRLALTTYLKVLLMMLVNHYATHPSTKDLIYRQQEALNRLQPLFHFIGRNCGHVVHVGDAARICGLSESYFMTFFRQVTGLSFVEYFKRYRIGRAQALLANTDDSMASISQEMGFCDQSHFGAVFRNAVGLTPLTYRRKFRKADSVSRGQFLQSQPGVRNWIPTANSPMARSGMLR